MFKLIRLTLVSMIVSLLVFALVCASPGRSAAVTLLSDNFDGEALGLNYTGFANWTVSDGTVDLIGDPGFFDFLPGNGRYVDLDGSTGDAGVMTSIALSLTGGITYVLSFDLAGSQRGDTNTVTYGIDLNSDSVLDFVATQTLASGVPFTPISLSFTPSAATSNARIVFDHDGGDNFGLLLDNVNLKSNAGTVVPEPSTVLLLGSGLIGLLMWQRP